MEPKLPATFSKPLTPAQSAFCRALIAKQPLIALPDHDVQSSIEFGVASLFYTHPAIKIDIFPGHYHITPTRLRTVIRQVYTKPCRLVMTPNTISVCPSCRSVAPTECESCSVARIWHGQHKRRGVNGDTIIVCPGVATDVLKAVIGPAALRTGASIVLPRAWIDSVETPSTPTWMETSRPDITHLYQSNEALIRAELYGTIASVDRRDRKRKMVSDGNETVAADSKTQPEPSIDVTATVPITRNGDGIATCYRCGDKPERGLVLCGRTGGYLISCGIGMCLPCAHLRRDRIAVDLCDDCVGLNYLEEPDPTVGPCIADKSV